MDVNDFVAMKIGLASPEQIMQWSFGEVKKPETINYRTLKPERDGLFCERIFGPTKDWECHCGKYKRVRFKGLICDKCGVEVTRSKVRRERMGHIKLAAPVTHIWYFKGTPSRIGLLLDLTPRMLEKIIYFMSYVVIKPGDPKVTGLEKNQLISEPDWRAKRMELQELGSDVVDSVEVGMGAEAILKMLSPEYLDLDGLYEELKSGVREQGGSVAKRTKMIKRLGVVEAFRKSGNKPEWMVLTVVPVIPPDLRPMVQLDGARFATSDLNDLYRRVINRNNRLKRLQGLGAPDIIVKNEKRMLQEAVDALIDNGRRGRPVTGPNSRPLKSLSDMLKGKQGRFRQNLLGKRVDYSGRSVIVVGPKLKLHQCGLPKEMALELFKPFVMKKLQDSGICNNIKSAKRKVERVEPCVWDALEQVIIDHPVLLNRAPTLHRLGIQAFEPVLVEGKAIQLHPLVCTPYNADFDGDQMAVHLPLSAGAQAEARLLMLSAHNILLPAYGSPATTPTQDMILGMYYLTIEKHDSKGEGKLFSSIDEAMLAYDAGVVELQAPIRVQIYDQLVRCTVGRLFLWNAVPENIKLHSISPLKGTKLGKGAVCFEEINRTFCKKDVVRFVKRVHSAHGNTRTASFLDNLKALGYKFATRSGTTISVTDIKIPPEKPSILEHADKLVQKTDMFLRRGLLTEDEHYHQLMNIWSTATNEVESAMMRHLDRLNPVFMMATSGARGNPAQVKQLAGMRGLMADPTGRIIPLPIRANLREGLTVLEYFIGTHGARKGLADTALRTADSGYLTRRLIDVSQDIIVRKADCGCTRGTRLGPAVNGKDIKEGLAERLVGRFLVNDLEYEDRKGNKCFISKDEMIDEEHSVEIEAWLSRGMNAKGFIPEEGVPEHRWKRPGIEVRSVLTCRATQGVCSKCYGKDLATGKRVEIGATVGIVAAQSIGEPGTQLTLRTFHTGGVAQDDIIQGLPRVEELFEARKPKNKGELAGVDGVVSLGYDKGMRLVTITGVNPDNPDEEVVENLHLPVKAVLTVEEGDTVKRGDVLVEGFMDPHRVLEVRGLNAVQNYIVDQVQTVYRDQGVDINDKHIEVIVRQMLRKVKIVDSNDTDFLPGSTQDRLVVDDVNETVENTMVEDVDEEGNKYMRPGKGATYSLTLLGVTKASLATESFLSAASFQETTKVLTEAAVCGKTDYLRGLKENVIIGKLIPAGTGMEEYRKVDIGLSSTAIPYNVRNIRMETERRDMENADNDLIMGLQGPDPIESFETLD